MEFDNNDKFIYFSFISRLLPVSRLRKIASKNPPPPQRKIKYSCKYQNEWANTFPVNSVSGDPSNFYCIPCGKTVSCEKQGRGDVVRHCDPTKVDSNHNKNVRAKTVSSQIPFVADSSIQDKNVMKAEILHTGFIVQHNISINTAEHLNKLYSKMFPDSKIVKNFHCSRTKTTCILNNALAPELKGYLCDFMKNEPYSLVNDGSNDNSVKKMNAAGQGGKAYANISGFDMEEHRVDIYYYFKKKYASEGNFKGVRRVGWGGV